MEAGVRRVVNCTLGPSVAIATDDLGAVLTDYLFERVYMIRITWVLSGRDNIRTFSPLKHKDI